ncbi:beta-lactamase [Candidatus Magnetomorum sp. HK-1]|nr:beta-lactamase [Candidatus Magnetomorum sp. HK-1]
MSKKYSLLNYSLFLTISFLHLFPSLVQGNMLNKLSEYVEEKMQSDKIPGVAVAIVEDSKIVFVKGFGYRDLENKLPVTPETLFHIGSNTKSMTALIVASLIDEGKADWDTPIIQYYSDFALEDSKATELVTFRHLLSMRAGIPESAEDDLLEVTMAKDIFGIIENAEILGNPGDIFEYSNLSSAAAGYIAAILSGTSLDALYEGYIQLIKQKVLNPIGMKTACVRASEAEKNPNYGKSYELVQGKLEEAETEDIDEDPLAPSGSLKASASEMALYLTTLINQGMAPNGNSVISTENVTETWKTYLEDYGMGFEKQHYNNIEIIGHEGSFDNYLSVFGFSTELNMGYFIITNCENTSNDLITEGPKYIVDLYISDREVSKGDVDGSETIDLKDIILVLQVSSGKKISLNMNADVNQDGRIGIIEAIFGIKEIAGF